MIFYHHREHVYVLSSFSTYDGYPLKLTTLALLRNRITILDLHLAILSSPPPNPLMYIPA